jgi:hypothetical protein
MKLLRVFVLIVLIAVPVILTSVLGKDYLIHGLTGINWYVTIPLGILFGMVVATLKGRISRKSASEND